MTPSIRSVISQVPHWFGYLEKWTLVILVTFLTGFAILQIVLRNFFSTGIIWGDTLLRHIVLWVSLIGTARATAERKHIRIDFLPRLLPPKAVSWLDAFCDAVASLVSAVLLYASWNFIRVEKMAGDLAFAGIPYWWLQIIFPVSFALMTIRFGYRVLETLLHGPKGRAS